MSLRMPLLLALACTACVPDTIDDIDDIDDIDAAPDGGAPPSVLDGGQGAEPDDAGSPSDAGNVGSDGGSDAGPLEVDAGAADLPDPILFVHGINGSAADFDTLIASLIADGWPAERLFAHSFPDPEWGCNVDNAASVGAWIESIRSTTGAARVDLVAHSMGTLSTRHYVKFLGGTETVDSYVTLGGQHLGLWQPCTAFLGPGDDENVPCVWSELCMTRDFIAALNAEPATPGDAVRWVSIYSTADEVVPATSSELDGAENIELEDIDHVGLLSDPIAYQAIVTALD